MPKAFADTNFDVFEVFTPTSQACRNFVERKELSDRLTDALKTPGMQLVVYGETGSGKSTLIHNKLRQIYPDHITTQCSADTSFEGLILAAFDKLNPYFTSERHESKTAQKDAQLSAQYLSMSAAIRASEAISSKKQRMLPPQLTPERLAELMGAAGLCWVIDDFHKTHREVRLRVAQSMKVFHDVSSNFRDVKLIAIGAVDSADQIVQLDREMRGRVAEIRVPLMENDELKAIISNGMRLMNVIIDDNLRDSIIQLSCHIASTCHALCLNLCQHRDYLRPTHEGVAFTNDDLTAAIGRYINNASATITAAFDAALYRKRRRTYDNCRLILEALAEGPIDGMRSTDILDHIRKSHSSYPSNNFYTYMRELMSDARHNIVRHSVISDLYRFADPFYHAHAKHLFHKTAKKTRNDKLLELLMEFAEGKGGVAKIELKLNRTAQ